MTLIEIRAKIRKLLGGISSTAYSDADILTAVNDYYLRGINLAIGASDKWEVNGEVATTNIVSGQREYVLTTETPLQALSRIEVNLTGATNGYSPVDIVDVQTYEGIISNSNISSGIYPKVYLLDNSIFFIDTPSTSVASGLKIYYDKSAIELTNGGITTVSINDGGTGYTVNDTLTVVSSGASGGIVTVTQVSGGVVTEVEVSSYGAGYIVANANTTTGGTGAGCKINVLTIDGVEPQLLEEAQIYLVDGACLDYATSLELTNKINIFSKRLEESEKRIKDMYSNRLKAVRPRIKTKQIICE